MPTTLASLLFLIHGAIIRVVVFVGIQLVNLAAGGRRVLQEV